jgi:hypothetical protein
MSSRRYAKIYSLKRVTGRLQTCEGGFVCQKSGFFHETGQNEYRTRND